MRPLYINGRYLTQQVTGVQRFAAEMVRALDDQMASGALPAQGPVFLVSPRGDFALPQLHRIQHLQRGRLHGHAWEQLELPRFAAGGLLFNPCGPAPLFHPRQVTTLHDASIHVAPAGYSWQFRAWHTLLLWRTGRHARRLVTVSNFSKQQLVDVCGISAEKIQVIYPAGDHILRRPAEPGILRRQGLDDGVPYVLCVGSRHANKNLAAVAEASSLLEGQPLRFVVVGSTNASVFRDQSSVEHKMRLIGYVSDSELRALYESALCFVFPSLQEGFGLPPVEAMCCGCPVIASNTTSIPEACGAAALYFDPLQPKMLAETIAPLLADSGLRSRLSHQGVEHSRQRSWQDAARQLSALLWSCASGDAGEESADHPA